MSEQMPDRIWARYIPAYQPNKTLNMPTWGSEEHPQGTPYRLETPELLRALRIAAVCEDVVNDAEKHTPRLMKWTALAKLKSAMEETR